MSKYLIVPREAPRPPYECELFDLDIPAIPFMLSALGQRAAPFYWTNQDEATAGRQMLAKQAASLLMPCGKDIVVSVNQVYRLLDTHITGVQYLYDDTLPLDNPEAYRPMIPPVPTIRDPAAEPSILFYIAKTMREVDNLANGTVYDDAPDSRNFRQQLEDLIAALEGENLDPEILAKLVEILAALA